MDSQTTIATAEGVRDMVPAAPEGAAIDPLMVLALTNKVPVETVERIAVMIERREEKVARQKFIEAMARFRATCPLVQKPRESKQASQAGTTRTGAGFNFKYAPLDEITETIRPHAEANGLSYTWTCRTEPGFLIVTCKLQHVGGHAETCDFPTPIAGSVATNDQHKFGAAFTYGRRQSLFGAFGLATTDETPDRPQDMEAISAEQAANLRSMLDELPEARRVAFYKWIGFTQADDIPSNRYAEAVAALEKARKGGAS